MWAVQPEWLMLLQMLRQVCQHWLASKNDYTQSWPSEWATTQGAIVRGCHTDACKQPMLTAVLSPSFGPALANLCLRQEEQRPAQPAPHLQQLLRRSWAGHVPEGQSGACSSLPALLLLLPSSSGACLVCHAALSPLPDCAPRSYLPVSASAFVCSSAADLVGAPKYKLSPSTIFRKAGSDSISNAG